MLSPLPKRPFRRDSSPSNQSQSQSSSIESKISYEGKTGNQALDRRFSRSWLRSRLKSDSPSNDIGPLGLRPIHLSAEPLVDLVFVHGLRGGSMKTWRKGNDPRLYWPQNWLPLEPDFQNANIHSFGYNADFRETKDSILNVQDFGRALLSELRTSPHIRTRKNHPIILIGHSMGGLVLKVAYILAHEDARDPEYGQRIRCLFFLATPHRGSALAALLNNTLRLSGVLSAKPYVGDLERNSASAQRINDDFKRCVNDSVSLWSFYETVQTSMGVASSLIVDRESAILGFGYETVQYLNGDHRDICKYDNPEDPNYITIKNALATAISTLLSGVQISRDETYRAQVTSLRAYLDVSDRPEDDFANQKDTKVAGSCQWLEARDDFQSWRDVFEDTLGEKHDNVPQLYWLSAKPGAGKTVLAGHVVAHLQNFHLDCSYYFFHHGNKSGQSLSGLLRSLAYQMARSNTSIRELLHQIKDDGVAIDKDDERSIWRKLFLGGILQAKIYRPQYWVIDALDECIKYAEFFTLLSNVETAFPLRILVTSRIMPDIQLQFLRFGKNVVSREVDVQDSMRDIEAYIHTRIEALPLDGSNKRQDLANKILAKSGGCFLWVHLVLHELSNVYTDKSIWTVLDEIPEGMMPFYQRSAEIMARNTRELDTAKAILLWAIYSVRPLRTLELQQALKLDIGANVLNIKKTIEGLCGQLVYVDKNDTVQIVHPTAREFFIGDTTSEFAIPKQKGHERLALSCLRYLNNEEMRPPRNRRLINISKVEASEFRDYACTAFSEHVFSAFSEADTLLSALDLFLKTNVLSWVEHVAQKDTLYYITRTAKNLRGYLGRRAKYLSPLGSQVERVDNWVTDLTRLVAKFGVALTTVPSAIYFLIPPLCPTTSAIFRQFGRSADGLVLDGVKKIAWEDCISWIDFEQSATSLASGDKAFAVGLETGDIEIYNQGSCQWERTIHHHEHIDILKFETSGNYLATCSFLSIKLWDRNGNEVWAHKLKSRCIELSFQKNALIGVSMNGNVTNWNLKTGELIGEPHRYLHREPDDESGKTQKAPGTASISPDFQIIALGTRRTQVCLWSLQDHDLIGWCLAPEADSVDLVMFNPNPDIGVLVVGYNTSRLAIFDSWSQEMIQSVRAGNGHQRVASLASSPDGRTLVSVDHCGNMQVWDFETLTLLYQVTSSDLGFRVADFSSSGLRILDLMSSKLRVWEPTILIRKTIDEDVSVSDAAILPAIHGQDHSRARQEITAMACHATLPIVYVGKYSGAVAAYASHSGKEETELYVHPNGAFVTAIAVGPDDILASGDVNGNVQVWKLARTPARSLRTGSLILATSTHKAIQQLLISPSGEFILVSTATVSSVFSSQTGTCIGKLDSSQNDQNNGTWLLGAATKPELLLILGDGVARHSWDSFPSLVSPHALLLPPGYQKLARESVIKSAVLDSASQNLIIDLRQDRREIATKALLVVSVGTDLSATLAMAASTSTTAAVVLGVNPACLGLSDCIKYFLGVSGSRLMFVDNASWLSSADLKVSTPLYPKGEYTRHFFVPNEFVTRETGILPMISLDKDVIFGVEGELAVVRNGLKFQKTAKLGEVGRKWSYESGIHNQ
ncbi:MAG: hypothetical protein MMC33_001599 [Icmadophila ericetorum]|nr:hypothetical protein [Icmadophila ericetorum]